jgi:hypothetical protein
LSLTASREMKQFHLAKGESHARTPDSIDPGPGVVRRHAHTPIAHRRNGRLHRHAARSRRRARGHRGVSRRDRTFPDLHWLRRRPPERSKPRAPRVAPRPDPRGTCCTWPRRVHCGWAVARRAAPVGSTARPTPR